MNHPVLASVVALVLWTFVMLLWLKPAFLTLDAACAGSRSRQGRSRARFDLVDRASVPVPKFAQHCGGR